MQGKLISFTAKVNNGIHESYTGSNGTLYKFNVTMDVNGTQITGTAMSKNTQPNWKLNEVYTFDEKISGQNGQYRNFSNMKPINGFNGQKKSDPKFVLQKCFEGALECAFNFMKVTKSPYDDKALDGLSNLFWNTVINGNEQRRWINLSTLRLAIQKIEIMPETAFNGMKKSEWVVSQVKFLGDTMQTTVNNQAENDKNAGQQTTN